MKIESSRKNLKKYSDIKFNENPSSGSRVVACAKTDRHDEANSRFSQICELARKSKRQFIGDRNVLRHKNSEGSNQLSLTGNFWRFLQKLTSKAHTHTHCATQLSTVNHPAMRCRQNSHIRTGWQTGCNVSGFQREEVVAFNDT
jgi:hypothetical protein